MPTVHLVVGCLLIAVNLAAGIWGAWRWYHVEASHVFWRMLRIGQGLIVIQAVLGGVLVIAGHHAKGSLHILYGVLPLAVSFVAEQLKIASADAVLSARDLDNAQQVGTLPAEEQRVIVLSIVRRELGVMALSCFVVVGLAIRAATTA